MNMSGLDNNNPVVVSAFHRALLHQGFVVLGLAVVVLVAWNVARAAQYRRLAAVAAPGPADSTNASTSALAAEPAARRFLRIAFGLLWIFDGILQGQASMPLGLVTGVVQPAASSSPGWVQHLVDNVARVWTYHPVTAAAAAVWIQVGIGLWMLVAPRGNWSRLGGMAGAGWGLMIWVFGEAFGGVFGQGLSWLTGAPGSALLYTLAGVLVALPETAWRDRRPGRYLLGALGLFLLGMAVLQAWPGRGFWQGQATASASPGSLTSFVQGMAGMSQPALLQNTSSGFASFDASHGWAVNLFAVVVMAAVGLGLLARSTRINRAAVVAGTVFSVAVWVLIQDLGFMGGVGTDPNSAVPFALLMIAGYVAVTRPAPATTPVAAPAAALSPAAHATPRTARAPRPGREPIYAFRAVAAAAAVAVTVLGAAPMAVASVRNQADPILSTAVNGPPQPVNIAAAPFRLTAADGRTVSLSSLAGKVVALTFLDPVCTNDCPIIAQEFRQADDLLGSDRSQVVMVAINANPTYVDPAYLQAFDQQEHLDGLSNWDFLTGSAAQLAAAWKAYGVDINAGTGGAMIDHSDLAYVIDTTGHTRWVIDATPGPGTSATQSSFAVTLADTLRKVAAGDRAPSGS